MSVHNPLRTQGKLLLLSFVSSAGLTVLSLFRVYNGPLSYALTSDGRLPSVLALDGRGYPFYFLVKTWGAGSYAGPTQGLVVPSLLADLLFWFLVSLAVLLVIRLLIHKTF